MKDDKWRMINEEWWWMNEEWWRMMISSCWGVLVTDRLTDIGECRVAFATEKCKIICFTTYHNGSVEVQQSFNFLRGKVCSFCETFHNFLFLFLHSWAGTFLRHTSHLCLSCLWTAVVWSINLGCHKNIWSYRVQS